MDVRLPLTGVRVVDRTDGLGEMTSRLLADLGADVIRVEPPEGAASRRQEPVVDGVSLYYATHNANKRAVVAGPDDFRRLVDTADILVTHAAGDLDELRDRRPELVVVAVTDFGLTGPYRDWQATEWTHLALSGALCRSGLPGREPLLPPGSLAYESAATQAAWAALVAYYNRLDNGVGDLVDVSVYEATAQAVDPGFGIAGSAGGGVPAADGPRGRPDARHLYPIFPCADGSVRICILAPRQWKGMFTWLGEPAEFADPELAKLHRRFAAAGEIYPAIGRLFATRTREQIVAEGQQYGVPTAALLSPTEVLHAEQFTTRGAFTGVPSVPGALMPDGLVEVDGRRAGIRTPAPEHGQHTGEVLAALKPVEPATASTAPAGRTRPLAGLRVLDLGVIVVGAELGRLFADMGADVIKVENKAFPDGSRQTFDGALVSASFAYGHRNKLGLGLDLRSDEGVAIFKRLVAQSDLVVSNFKPGTMESLGLGYDQLKAVNPRIIVADSSAFGPTGPWSRRLGYGPLVRAAAGLSGLWRYPDREDGFSDASTVYPDHVAARVEAVAVLAKLIGRRRDGRGGTVSVAQAEVILGQLQHQLAFESVRPGTLVPVGNDGPDDAPYGLYPCAGDDEWCVVTVRGDDDWRRLNDVLKTDLDLPAARDRIAHRDRIDAAVRAWTADRSPRQAMAELQAAGVPAAMMQRVPELRDDPHLVHRGFFRTMHHPRIAEPMPTENGPALFQHVEEPPLEPAPVMGEHSRAVLIRVLGMSGEEVDALIAEGVVDEFC
ncbi:crotonobetainyl-CoA:carnitine CoA-transferase CaiB-like acyl-CoA transferase [Actinoplanes tereljensis]|uniref:CoA-transferase n=1 Tax=Paractinoplanes tereljensis TaxID=571912 RepID=A0A919NZC4_9ACTN|nr:CoA transferase [Actinoplanes tereljensis]GIF26711.1 putative CoA-transferase [Actinoplanes tereljensis]